MRYFGCGINKIVSVLIRPGSVVRVHNGPPKVTIGRTPSDSLTIPSGGIGKM